ncbi:MAG: YbjQ family protein [Planctomycetes bacterium]|nr:YbjQ family protein [Planctomycetota bacterium]
MTKPGALLPVTTGPDIEGYKITRVLGVVRGIVVRSPGFKRGIVGSFKTLFSGNIKEFEEVCEQARAEAYGRMVAHANLVDADAIVAMRYDATDFAQGVTEVLAYGTAVKLAPA